MDIELTLDAFNQVKLDNKIHVVTTGEEALDYMFGRGKYENRREYPLPNLILLDIKLPGINGSEVLESIKSAPVIKRIPVIILTSSKEEGDREEVYDNGANSYLVKPIFFEEFIEVADFIGNYWLTLNVEPPIK